MLFDIFENIFKNGGRNLLLIGTVGTLGISLYLAGLYYFDDFVVYI
ncbi:hypothetical protein F985_00553 [Acinetobacter seifertii]|uniref:Uncharacterized protein n=1 Tax=Acinetobacter seifertii TaxID=1530123 RepID=N8R1D0_9GAMM|nr:hypothetical protein F985_00553 [Acinetobacter seifertii]